MKSLLGSNWSWVSIGARFIAHLCSPTFDFPLLSDPHCASRQFRLCSNILSFRRQESYTQPGKSDHNQYKTKISNGRLEEVTGNLDNAAHEQDTSPAGQDGGTYRRDTERDASYGPQQSSYRKKEGQSGRLALRDRRCVGCDERE